MALLGVLALAELAFSIKKYRESQSLLRDALEGFRAMGDRIGVSYCRILQVDLRSKLNLMPLRLPSVLLLKSWASAVMRGELIGRRDPWHGRRKS